jgi:hypothetical protein
MDTGAAAADVVAVKVAWEAPPSVVLVTEPKAQSVKASASAAATVN